MDQFIKGTKVIPPKTVFGGDDEKPASGEAFVYLGTSPLVARHNRPVIKSKTTGSHRTTLTLMSVPIDLAIRANVRPTWGTVYIALKGSVGLEPSDKSLVAFASAPFDPYMVVHDALAQAIQTVGTQRLRHLSSDLPNLEQGLRKILANDPRGAVLQLFGLSFTIDFDAPARVRLELEEEIDEVRKLARAAGLGDTDNLVLAIEAATNSSELELLRREILQAHRRNEEMASLRGECLALKAELATLMHPVSDHEEHMIAKLRDVARLTSLRDVLAGRLEVYRTVMDIEANKVDVPRELIDSALANPTADTLGRLRKAAEVIQNQALEDLAMAEARKLVGAFELTENQKTAAFIFVKAELKRNGGDYLAALQRLSEALLGKGARDFGIVQVGDMILNLPQNRSLPEADPGKPLPQDTRKNPFDEQD